MSEQTIKELKTALVIERAHGIKAYDDAYPEVGMGKPFWVCLAEAQKSCGYADSDLDMAMLKAAKP